MKRDLLQDEGSVILRFDTEFVATRGDGEYAEHAFGGGEDRLAVSGLVGPSGLEIAELDACARNGHG